MKQTKIQMMMAFLFVMICAPLLALAQEVAPVVVEPISDLDFISKVLSFIGSLKGMTSAAIALAAVQLVIMFLKSSFVDKLFHKMTSQLKWIIVTGMTLLAGYFTAVGSGQPSGQAIVAMLALPMFQEFLYQIYKQFIQKKNA